MLQMLAIQDHKRDPGICSGCSAYDACLRPVVCRLDQLFSQCPTGFSPLALPHWMSLWFCP